MVARTHESALHGTTRSLLATRTVALFAAFSLAVVACSSDPESGAQTSPAAAFCSALKDGYARCAGSSACPDAIAADCTKMAALLNPSLLGAATKCVQTAGCSTDPLACLGSSLGAMVPTTAQSAFASDYCASCSVVGGDTCSTAFFGTGSVPGLGYALLPFGDAAIQEIDTACTSSKLGKAACQAGFSSCLSVEAAKVLGESISADSATCLLAGIKAGLTPGSVDGGSDGGGCADCAGCCDNGTCQTGDTAAACGAKGAACEKCQGGASCTAGACVATCGPDNCPGCCDGNICKDGTATTACGTSGAACAACAGSATCANNQCIDPSCKASCASGCCSAAGCQPGNLAAACGTGGNACTNCGSGHTCGGGACGFDPSSVWDLVLVGAHVPAADLGGGAWDGFGGLPDPYAKVTSGASAGSTANVSNTLTPVWNAKVLSGAPASALIADLKIELWDADTAFDDFMGGCSFSVIPLGPAQFDGNLHTLSCPASSTGVALSVDYRIVPH